MTLLRDDDAIRERREKARANKGKFGGIGSGDVRTGGSFRGSGDDRDNYSSRDRDTYSSRDRDNYGSKDRDIYSSRDRDDAYGGGSRDTHGSKEDDRDTYVARNAYAGKDSGGYDVTADRGRDREFRSFSQAPARSVPNADSAQQQQQPATQSQTHQPQHPQPFTADFGDFEDTTPQVQQGGYVPQVVMSPAPAAGPPPGGRVTRLAPPPGGGTFSRQPAASTGGGLDALFAGMSTAPIAADPFGDFTGAVAPIAAPAAAFAATTPSVDFFSLDVPAAQPAPAMGGGGGISGHAGFAVPMGVPQMPAMAQGAQVARFGSQPMTGSSQFMTGGGATDDGGRADDAPDDAPGVRGVWKPTHDGGARDGRATGYGRPTDDGYPDG